MQDHTTRLIVGANGQLYTATLHREPEDNTFLATVAEPAPGFVWSAHGDTIEEACDNVAALIHE